MIIEIEKAGYSMPWNVSWPSCPWSNWLRPKKIQLVWKCHQVLSGFLAKGHLPRVSRQSRRSLMIRVIMK